MHPAEVADAAVVSVDSAVDEAQRASPTASPLAYTRVLELHRIFIQSMMRMRRTLTKVLCVTLVVNVSFLSFVIYSRISREARRNALRMKRQMTDAGTAMSRIATLPNVEAPLTVEEIELRRRAEDLDNDLRRDWKMKILKTDRRPAQSALPPQLFNVEKSRQRAQCAEFLHTPVWFVSPPLKRSPIERQAPGDFWQRVGPSNSDFYVYSAYFDVKGTTFWETGKTVAPVVRIIGVTIPRFLKKPLFCQMWFKTHDKLRVEQAMLSVIPENHNRNYTATYFLCPLWIPGVAPYAVSLVTEKCSKPQNLLYVHQTPKKKIPSKDFTVCVTPLNRGYNKASELIQMIEFNRLFGADYFQFYNFSTGPDVDLILLEYAKEGLVEIVPWHLPLKVDTWSTSDPVEIHYFGQLAALNDCLYRNMFTSKFLVFTDMDELIVPRKHRYWSAMLDDLPELAVYHFRCTFFRRDWPPSPTNTTSLAAAEKLKLDYLYKLDRETTILPVFSRSKYILDPRKIETVGIHNVWVLRSGSQHVVFPHVATMHHYRKLNYFANGTHDPIILNFADKIVQNAKERWQIMTNITYDQLGTKNNVIL